MASNDNEARSQFYLHSSDNPGRALVSQHLTDDNYPTWRRAMRMALSAKNKLGFVDGVITKPTSPSSSVAAWEHCNDMVLSWLLNSLTPEIANSMIFAETAAAVWKDLEERFSQGNAPRIFQIKHAICTHIQDQTSLSIYFTKLKRYWDELASYRVVPKCTCGASKSASEVQQQEQVFQFLMGLNDSYSAIRTQILTMDPLLSIGKAYSMILQEEKQRDLHSYGPPQPDAAVFTVSKGHNIGSSVDKKRQQPRCAHGKRIRHTKAQCYKLHGYPPKQDRSDSKAAATAPLLTSKIHKDVDGVLSTPQLTPEQYQQLISILNISKIDTPQPSAHLAGPCHKESDWDG
eukprot:TRINITY_DN4986_c0_g1_i1.p1 TRINITY_DN4986_c0_g1~~TRINITY_DN4986_c0_g1_i1.p1  ORF type:complete len:364 (-),score=30.46 TRINITY_DN4986_c0_g1_i1:196-1233(-)